MSFYSSHNQLPFSADPTTAMDDFTISDSFNYQPLENNPPTPEPAIGESHTPHLNTIPSTDPNDISSVFTPYLPDQNPNSNDPYCNPPPFPHSLPDPIAGAAIQPVIEPCQPDPSPAQFLFPHQNFSDLYNLKQSPTVAPVRQLPESHPTLVARPTPPPFSSIADFRAAHEPLDPPKPHHLQQPHPALIALGGVGCPTQPFPVPSSQPPHHNIKLSPRILTPATPSTPSNLPPNPHCPFSPLTPQFKARRTTATRRRRRTKKIDKKIVKELPQEWKNIWDTDFSQAVPIHVLDSLYAGVMVQAREVATGSKLKLRDSLKKQAESGAVRSGSKAEVSSRREARVSREFQDALKEQMRCKLIEVLKKYAGLWYRLQQVEGKIAMDGPPADAVEADAVGASPSDNGAMPGDCAMDDMQFGDDDMQEDLQKNEE